VFKFDKYVKKMVISSLNEKFLLIFFSSDACPNSSDAEVERWNRDFTPADGADTIHTTVELKKLPYEHGDCIKFHSCRTYNFTCTVIEDYISYHKLQQNRVLFSSIVKQNDNCMFHAL
jgi:hypothetical protein